MQHLLLHTCWGRLPGQCIHRTEGSCACFPCLISYFWFWTDLNSTNQLSSRPLWLHSACPVCCEDTLPVTTEAFQIFQISRQCMLKPSSQWVNKHVLKAFHIGEYLHVNEDWIFFPFLLCLSHIIYYETHQCLLWLWIKSWATVVPLKWKAETDLGHTIRRNITQKALHY